MAGTGDIAVLVNPVTNKAYFLSNSAVQVFDGATNQVSSTGVVSNPLRVAVNPVTNTIYVVNGSGGSVAAIDGVTGNTATLNVVGAQGGFPLGIAVNPATNKIYVTIVQGQVPYVTVIDGATNGISFDVLPFVQNGFSPSPSALAVNPVTNKIYVASPAGPNSGQVWVIDGASNSAALIAGAGIPGDIAINPVTNKIYVADQYQSIVTVIDGATDTVTTTVPTGCCGGAGNTGGHTLGVNPITNKIYEADANGTTMTVIDGATNAPTTVQLGAQPVDGLVVNSANNKVYIDGAGYLAEVDGVTNIVAPFGSGSGINGWFLNLNPTTNKIYSYSTLASNFNTTVIDGDTNTWTSVSGVAGNGARDAAVNPVTNRIYVVNSGGPLQVITEQQVSPIPLTTAITPLTNNQTASANPAFTFTVTSGFSPNATIPDSVYYQVDTQQSTWSTASGSNGTFTATLPCLQPGFHTLYAFAGDGQEGGFGGTLLTGAISAYGFLVTQPAACVAITVSVNTPGLVFTADGQLYLSATTFNWTPGSTHTISTISPQTDSSGTSYKFLEWSTGFSPLTQTITVPTYATSYSADFIAAYTLTTGANPPPEDRSAAQELILPVQ